MRSLLTILNKDLKSYFDQPTGYILNIILQVPELFDGISHRDLLIYDVNDLL